MNQEQQNQYLDFLINPSFQEVNRLFVLSFKMMEVEQATRDIIFHL